jgi:tRNA-specific 2-thiouridylase
MKKVFVGLSGGVDSAVSAALLKKDGFDVTGVFIKAWTPPGYPCTWKEDRRSAMRVAAILDIPFITLDLEKEYKKEVVDYMIAEYKEGRTPNPDVMCNKEIKFGHFLKFALDNGADFVATGHYARTLQTKLPKKVLEKSLACATRRPPPALTACRAGEDFSERSFFWQLWEGTDKNKDQSYFLWTLTQDQLKHILFPIGDLQKPEVRKLAGKFGLPQAARKDSQGLCFLGKVDMKGFLARYIPQKKGEVLNSDGEKIGYHNGALFFTIGERHGFNITNKLEKKTPLYVIEKNVEKNTITVAPAVEKLSSNSKSVILKNINIIGEIPNKKLLCRIRYRQEKIDCKFDGNKVIFDKSQMGVAPGQSLVLYKDEICLGGGIIVQ